MPTADPTIHSDDGRRANGRRNWFARGLAVLILISLLITVPVFAQPASSALDDDDAFLKGLLELRLFRLLDYHLEHNPPENELAARLIQREIKLARRDDSDVTPEQSQQLLAEANAILESVIKNNVGDQRSLDWRLKLARSMLYEQAEPYYSSILYRGLAGEYPERLEALMRRATSVLSELVVYLDSEYARLDELSIRAYERLEETGYVDQIETSMPETEYMLRWARFYLGLSLPAESREHRELLAQVLTEIRDKTPLLREDHSITHVQAQSLLLAGMASRLLGDFNGAVNYLGSAVTVTSAIADPAERRDLQWVATLGSIERVRTLRDAGRFDAARSAAQRLASLYESDRAEDFGMRLVAAMLETSIAMSEADAADKAGKTGEAQRLRHDAMDPLEKLAEQNPANRDQIYANVYELTRGEVRALHPFETTAIIAGQIAEARKLLAARENASGDLIQTDTRRDAEDSAVALLDDAITQAKSLIASADVDDANLKCEARFNLAVAQFQRGLRFEAADNFHDVASKCPEFFRAESAAQHAVEIAAQLAEDPSLGRRTDVRTLFAKTLHTLIDQFADSESAAYWRFFLAQMVEDEGRFAQAGRIYESVHADHPHGLLARFRAARCQIEALKALVQNRPDDIVEIKRDAVAARAAMKRFLESIAGAGDDVQLERLRAEGAVLLAEMAVLSGVNEPDAALELLDGFEQRYGGGGGLLGRVLRTRIVAFEAAGRLDDARAAVPRFMNSAPDEAGPTLQALFDSNWTEVKRLRRDGRFEEARDKAESALLFAQQLDDWAKSGTSTLDATQRQYVRLQLAEAKLEAGRVAEARAMFESLADNMPDNPRILTGMAEVMYRSGRYGEALTRYNRLYQLLPANDEQRFMALLRDLQCRTELGNDPDGIIKTIKQHRFLSPDLGGEQIRAQFIALLERNEARAARQ